MIGEEDLSERSARLLLLLLPERAGEGRSIDGAILDEELAELLGARPPGVDDAALVEPDPRFDLAGNQAERPGATAEMDELQGVRDRNVFEVAGEAHRPQPRLTSWIRLSRVFSLRSVAE